MKRFICLKSVTIILIIFRLMDKAFCLENSSTRRVALKQQIVNNLWTDQSKSVFDYDVSNKLNKMEHYEWRNDQWENDATITYTYNSSGQLEIRQEQIMNTSEPLSYEIYDYDTEGRLVQISFPDIPWYTGRGLFGVSTSSNNILYDPYLLISHIDSIQYIYNDFGVMTNIEYNIKSDKIQNSIGFFLQNNSSKLHPMDPVISTPETYNDSMKTLEPVSSYNKITTTGTYLHITNGHQLSVIYTHPSHLTYQENHRYWDLYEIWYPNEMRNIWIYSTDTDSNFISSPKTSHINPQQEILPFQDMLTFWLSTLSDDDSPILPIRFRGIYDYIDQAYYSSKIEKSLTLSNSYIPGNFYDYFYEPRYQGSYPVQNRKVLKTIEQYRLRLTKLNSPLFYGIGWDYQNEWINYLEREYEYNSSGHLERNIIKRWEWDKSKINNPNKGWWENDSRYEFLYDEEGNCNQIDCDIWHSESKEWRDHFRILYTYEDSINTVLQSKPVRVELTNYPNPFNASTHIRFLLTQPSKVSLNVYDVTGRLIRTILSEQQLTGQRHIYEWDGKDKEGNGVPSGMYLFHLTAGDNQIIKKCLLVK